MRCTFDLTDRMQELTLIYYGHLSAPLRSTFLLRLAEATAKDHPNRHFRKQRFVKTSSDKRASFLKCMKCVSETGRIRFRTTQFEAPSSVSFLPLTEFRGQSSVSSSQLSICVPKRTHRVFRRTPLRRVCFGESPNSKIGPYDFQTYTPARKYHIPKLIYSN